MEASSFKQFDEFRKICADYILQIEESNEEARTYAAACMVAGAVMALCALRDDETKHFAIALMAMQAAMKEKEVGWRALTEGSFTVFAMNPDTGESHALITPAEMSEGEIEAKRIELTENLGLGSKRTIN